MNRNQLTELCLKSIAKQEPLPPATIELHMNGDPNSRRIRLLGHHRGPYGKVIGWKGNDVIAIFDAKTVLDYLDSVSLSELPEDHDLRLGAYTKGGEA